MHPCRCFVDGQRQQQQQMVCRIYRMRTMPDKTTRIIRTPTEKTFGCLLIHIHFFSLLKIYLNENKVCFLRSKLQLHGILLCSLTIITISSSFLRLLLFLLPLYVSCCSLAPLVLESLLSEGWSEMAPGTKNRVHVIILKPKDRLNLSHFVPFRMNLIVIDVRLIVRCRI